MPRNDFFRSYMYKRCKLKVFSLGFSDAIFGKNNFPEFCLDGSASAKKPEHGSKLIGGSYTLRGYMLLVKTER